MPFDSKHEGMTVVTQDGNEVGTIESVRGDTAQVTPETGLSESIRRRLGWDDESRDTFELDYSNVDDVAGNEIKLER